MSVAWCLQHHRHLDKVLLVAVEPCTPPQVRDNTLNLTYYVVLCSTPTSDILEDTGVSAQYSKFLSFPTPRNLVRLDLDLG